MSILKTITLTLIATISILTANTTTADTTVREVTTYANTLECDSDLEQYATNFLKDIYNIDLDIPVYFSNILEEERAFGLFRYNTGLKTFGAKDIIIDNTLLNRDCTHWVEDILVHELVHYALFELNIEHGDGAETFEVELEYQHAKIKEKSNLNLNCCN